MFLFPLVERELRLAMRRPATYRIRMTVAAGAMILAIWGLWAWSNWITGSSAGHSLFRILAGGAFVGALSAGVALTADTISKERRQGTLGLLLLTDLKSFDVVSGKLAGHAIVPCLALLSLVPALSVFVVLGGVTAGELWRTMLMLFNTLFVSLSFALLTSTLCVEQRMAHASALLAMAMLTGGPSAFEGLFSRAPGAPPHSLFYALGLVSGFDLSGEAHFRSAPHIF